MRVICGPMPCRECKRPVYFAEITDYRRSSVYSQDEEWRVRAIADRNGTRHRCIVWKAA